MTGKCLPVKLPTQKIDPYLPCFSILAILSLPRLYMYKSNKGGGEHSSSITVPVIVIAVQVGEHKRQQQQQQRQQRQQRQRLTTLALRASRIKVAASLPYNALRASRTIVIAVHGSDWRAHAPAPAAAPADHTSTEPPV